MPDISGELGTVSAGTVAPARAVPLSGWFGQRKFATLAGIYGATAVGAVFYSVPGSYDWLLVDRASRLYDWITYCGIPGGIPNRTTVYTTLNSSSGQTAIQNAIAACPAGQVVQLSAGTYSHGLNISTANQSTLRGAGAGQTIFTGEINVTGGTIGASADAWSNPRPIASGYTKGSMSIVLASTPPSSFVVGSNICIVQDDDYDLVWHRDGNWAGTHNLRFVSRITSVTTTVNANDTIGLATPIPYSYSASLNPICTAATNNVHLFGIEGITEDSHTITLSGADRCWVLRSEVKNYPFNLNRQGAILLQSGSTQCEIRRNYIHDPIPFPPDDDCFGIMLQYNNSCHLIEDNILARTKQILVNGSSANYFGYNYIYDTRANTTPTWVNPGITSNHGPHPIMNLYEGNIAQRFQNDGYHGSGSHDMIFRNHFHGTNPYVSNERRLIDLVRGSYFESVIGNVIGDPSYNPTMYQAGPLAYGHSQSTCYIIGWGTGGSGDPATDTTWFTNWQPALAGSSANTIYIATSKHLYPTGHYIGTNCVDSTRLAQGLTPNVAVISGFTYDDGTGRAVISLAGAGLPSTVPGNSIMIGPELNVETTLLRHGNYDYYNDAVRWDGGIASHDIPDSLFYDSKPSWFGARGWPAIDPVTPTVNTIPAKGRWDAYSSSGVLSDLFADEVATECDLYLDWHTGVDGNVITDAIAAGSCRPTSPTNVPDAYPGTTLTMMRIEADSASPVSGRINSGGVVYDIGDTTQGAIFDLSNSAREEMVLVSVSSHPLVASMGFMFRTDLQLQWAYWAPCGFLASGQWALLGIRYVGTEVLLYIHTNQGYSAVSIPIARNAWYWLTIQYNATTGYGSLAVFDPATWLQVGSTASLSFGGSNPTVNYWCVGGQENQGNQTSASWWYGPVIVDWTDGTFPLLPTP